MTTTLAGLFDISRGIVLGHLLIFVEELQIEMLERSVDSADILLLDERAASGGQIASRSNNLRLFLPDAETNAVIATLCDFSPIRHVYVGPSLEAIEQFVSERGDYADIWPSPDRLRKDPVSHDSTLLIQSAFKRNGRIPFLSMTEQRRRDADALLRSHVHPKVPIAVHLKNNPSTPGESNALFPAWWEFFGLCAKKQPQFRFVLIGNEPPPADFPLPENAMRSASFGSDLAGDLALIQESYAFMGMSSGPCQMALFSDVPYLIYKNPDHHALQMEAELGDADAYPFAGEFQKFRRIRERGEDLYAYLDGLVAARPQALWKQGRSNTKVGRP